MNITGLGRAWGALLTVLMLFAGSVSASAATVESVVLERSSTASEQVLIKLDQAAEYRVYELEAPQRLIVQITGATLASSLPQLMEGGKIVRKLTLRSDQSGVQVVLVLDGHARHSIETQGKQLLIRLFHAGKQAAASHAVLKDIAVRDLDGVTEVFLRGEHMDQNSNAFFVNDGKTMIVDFWGAESKLAKEHFSYASRRLKDITVGAAEGRLRLILNLQSGVRLAHQIEASPSQWVLRLGQVQPQRRETQKVVRIDFVPDGETARVIVRTEKANPIVEIQQKKNIVTVDIAHASLAEGLERSLDVSAFPGPVRQIDSYRRGDGVRIVARLREAAELTSFQSGNVLTVNFVRPTLHAGSKAAGLSAYHGEKVTFDFKDIDIRNALKLIAEMSDLNIIMSDDVQGKLTMRLVDVPWDQALDLILTAKGLGKEQEGNVVRIAPLAVLEAERAARIKARTTVQELEPLVTEFIHLGYASVKDIKALIEGAAERQKTQTPSSAGAASEANASTENAGLALLSSRGSLLMDERRNILIVTDTRQRVDNIKRLIAELDQPLQQVLIEARIVEASNSFSRDLGIKWGGTYNDVAGAGNRFSHRVGGALGGNLVDLPAQGPTGGVLYNLGTLSNVLNLNLELSAAEADQKIKVLSNPRVLTSNMQEARIEQIIEIPFTQTTAEGGILVTTTVVREAKLSLVVTPQITADNKVIMNIEIHKDTPQQNTLQPQGDPIIDKKILRTKLLVNNGETVVLGGIYSKTVSDTKNAVPGLSRIPLLGNLFRKSKKEDSRVELMLFITPTLVNSGGRALSGQPG